MKARPKKLLAVAIGIIASSALHAPASAQQTTPNTRSYVQLIRLKPDMVSEWMDLQRKEVIPAQKKAGVTARTTLVTQVGILSSTSS